MEPVLFPLDAVCQQTNEAAEGAAVPLWAPLQRENVQPDKATPDSSPEQV